MAMSKAFICVALLCSLLVVLAGSEITRRQARQGSTRTARRGRTNRCKDKWTLLVQARDLRRRPLQLKCPRGPIAEARMIGVKGDCRGYSPFLQMTANQCTWNSTCTIKVMGKTMDREAEDSTGENCLGQVPDKLEISYDCLKKNAPVKDALGKFQRTRKRTGIVRSHMLYPWSYRNGQQLGNVTFMKPRKPAGLSNLWITIRDLAILNTDVVFLSWVGQRTTENGRERRVDAVRIITANDSTFAVEDVDDVTLTFYADYQRHHSEMWGEERGFVLCYQWLKAGGRPRKGSTCTKVMVPGRCRGRKSSSRSRTRTSDAASSRGSGSRGNRLSSSNNRDSTTTTSNRRSGNNRGSSSSSSDNAGGSRSRRPSSSSSNSRGRRPSNNNNNNRGSNRNRRPSGTSSSRARTPRS